ncbi:MAG: SoxR reducing system RseC family protein [Firmicutes bacterium]|nr:SoxR reducing system RseC family protein [Bacillota bacterium]MDH7494956.1 SoxR reducing system RseC family protein [Bacillota bacterium]
MEERGRVIEVSGGLAKVEVTRHEACRHCGACGLGRADRMVVEATNAIGARPGDEVALELESSRVLGAAFIAYMIPLFFMMAGIYLGAVLARSAGRSGAASLLGVIFGLALLAASYSLVYTYDRRVNPARFRAEITRIVGRE